MLFMVESLGFSVLFFIGHIGVRRQNGQIVVFIRVKRRNSLSHRRGFIGKKKRTRERARHRRRQKEKKSNQQQRIFAKNNKEQKMTSLLFFVQIISKARHPNRTRVFKEIDIYYHCRGCENILSIIDFLEDDDYFYLVFQKMEGGNSTFY